MSANQIIALFCVHVGCGTPFPTELHDKVLCELEDLGLIDGDLTDKGLAYLTHIKNLPLPTQHWTMK